MLDLENVIDLKHFEFTGYKYDNTGLTSRTKLHRRKKSWRVYYYLPNGHATYFNQVPDLSSKKEREIYLAKFKQLLMDGYLPRIGAHLLRKCGFDQKNGNFDVYLEKYFSKYATSERQKGEQTIKGQKSSFKRILKFFKDLGLNSISEITDDHLKDWELDLNHLVNSKGEQLSGATKNNYRKLLRAFLNTAIQNNYPLQCNPPAMNIFEYSKGEIDVSTDVRSVIYPMELINKIQSSSFPQPFGFSADFRGLIKFKGEIGTRPSELFTLSEENLVFENGSLKKIRIKKLDCPNGDRWGFSPKNSKSYREICLSDFSAQFIEGILHRIRKSKRLGHFKGDLYEFPFLFGFWSEVHGAFIRDDQRLKNIFKDLTSFAIKEFNLDLKEDYILYDLRRTANFMIKTELNFTDEHAAAYLGHSVATNRKHYTLDRDKIFINNKRHELALMSAISNSPEIEKRFSRFASSQR